MIAVDTNILVAFLRTEYLAHPKAVESVTRLAEGAESWAIPWPCVHEFIAIVTNPRIFKRPTPVAGAADAVEALLESPSVRLLGEGPGHWPLLRRLVLKGAVVGGRIHDARVAAICVENGVRCLWTADRDFSRFPELKCRNPLVESA